MNDGPDRDSDRPEIARKIAAAQDRMVDSLNATRVHRGARFVANATRRPRPQRRVVWIAMGAAVAGAVLVVVVGAWPSSGPVGAVDQVDRVDQVAQGASTPGPSGARRVALTAGGSLEIAAGSVASVQSPKGKPVRVVLEAGALAVDSAQVSRRPVDVEAGPFRVHSEDSQASIAWDPVAETLTVDVAGGSMVVESVTLGTQQTIVAGDSVTLSAVKVTRSATVERPREAGDSALDSDPVPEPKSSSTRTRPSRASTWRSLASKGKHGAALQAAIEEGFGRLTRTASATDLLALARTARYGHDSKRAKQALQAVRKRFTKTSAAGRAAYALGRVAFDSDHDHRAAARWFATYLAEQPKGALAKEALGRLIEAERRSGASGAARSHARRYLDSYPDGPHADIARAAL